MRRVPLRWTRTPHLLHVAARGRLARDADTAAGSGFSFDPIGLNTPQLGFSPE
jgi:hypothetical protein